MHKPQSLFHLSPTRNSVDLLITPMSQHFSLFVNYHQPTLIKIEYSVSSIAVFVQFSLVQLKNRFTLGLLKPTARPKLVGSGLQITISGCRHRNPLNHVLPAM